MSIVGCATKPVPKPTIIVHNGCWTEQKSLTGSVQYGDKTVDIWETKWVARCDEPELRRLEYRGCVLVPLDLYTVMISSCKWD